MSLANCPVDGAGVLHQFAAATASGVDQPDRVRISDANERDHEALAHELIQAAQQPERLLQLGRAAAESIAQNFDQRTQTQRLEDLYLETIAASANQP